METNSEEERVRISKLEDQWKRLAGRDIQLWLIGFLVMVVILTGALSQFAPALFQRQVLIHFDSRYLPVLALGLIALVLLLNFYLIQQRRALDLVRYDLIREMAANQSLQQVALVDPETQFYNRTAVTKMLASEVSRANRFGFEVALLIFEPENFHQVRQKGSPFTADRMIVELATILKQTFRGCDSLFRYSKAEFLVVMPRTTEEEAVSPLKRLVENLDHWNTTSGEPFELSLRVGLSSYKSGKSVEAALKAAETSKKALLSLG